VEFPHVEFPHFLIFQDWWGHPLEEGASRCGRGRDKTMVWGRRLGEEKAMLKNWLQGE